MIEVFAIYDFLGRTFLSHSQSACNEDIWVSHTVGCGVPDTTPAQEKYCTNMPRERIKSTKKTIFFYFSNTVNALINKLRVRPKYVFSAFYPAALFLSAFFFLLTILFYWTVLDLAGVLFHRYLGSYPHMTVLDLAGVLFHRYLGSFPHMTVLDLAGVLFHSYLGSCPQMTVLDFAGVLFHRYLGSYPHMTVLGLAGVLFHRYLGSCPHMTVLDLAGVLIRRYLGSYPPHDSPVSPVKLLF